MYMSMLLSNTVLYRELWGEKGDKRPLLQEKLGGTPKTHMNVSLNVHMVLRIHQDARYIWCMQTDGISLPLLFMAYNTDCAT